MHTLIRKSPTVKTPAEKAKVTRTRNLTKHTLASAACGAWTGGIIPAITYAIAHFQAPNLLDGTPWTPKAALWLAVIGGLAYSAPTVASWFTRYSGQIKAWGFVLSLETAMTITDYTTAVPALMTLIAINGWVLADKFRND